MPTELGPFYPPAHLEASTDAYPPTKAWTNPTNANGAPDAALATCTLDGTVETRTAGLKWGVDAHGIDVTGSMVAAGWFAWDLVGVKFVYRASSTVTGSGSQMRWALYTAEVTGNTIGGISVDRFTNFTATGLQDWSSGGEDDMWGVTWQQINFEAIGSSPYLRNITGGAADVTLDSMALYLYFEKGGSLPNRTARHSRYNRTSRGAGNG